MDFELTPEQRSLTEAAAAFANEIARALPAEPARFATETHALVGARGLFGVAQLQSAAIVVAELARVSSSVGVGYASGWLFVDALRRHGAANADISSVAERAATGLLVGVVAAEARARAGIACGAEGPDGSRLVSGETAPGAVFPAATHAVVIGATESGEKLVACVDLASPGVARSSVPALGLARLPYGLLAFAGLHLAPRGVLSSGAAAASVATSLVRAQRILWSAAAVGIARFAFERTLTLVREASRVPQSTEFVVSDLATGLDAAWLSTLHAAAAWDAGNVDAAAAHGARLFVTRTAAEICEGALRVAGAAGYDDGLRDAFLDARHLELFDGESAADIDAIASELLGER